MNSNDVNWELSLANFKCDVGDKPFSCIDSKFDFNRFINYRRVRLSQSPSTIISITTVSEYQTDDFEYVVDDNDDNTPEHLKDGGIRKYGGEQTSKKSIGNFDGCNKFCSSARMRECLPSMCAVEFECANRFQAPPRGRHTALNYTRFDWIETWWLLGNDFSRWQPSQRTMTSYTYCIMAAKGHHRTANTA